jgi:hypothetical protein
VTIAACYVTPEGVVLGADSTASMRLHGGFHYFNFNQKVFEVSDEPGKGTMGIATWGLGGFGAISHRTLTALLDDDLKAKPPSDMAEVASRWCDIVWPHYTPLLVRCQALAGKSPFDKKALGSRDREEKVAAFVNAACYEQVVCWRANYLLSRVAENSIQQKRHVARAGAKSSARAHRSRANSNRARQAIWHSPFVRQRPGSRATQPHRGDAATFGNSAWSDAYSFLSVTRGAPLAPSSHSSKATLLTILAPSLASTRRLQPHCQHRSPRGRVCALTRPIWPHCWQAILSIIPDVCSVDSGGEQTSAITRARVKVVI